MYHRSSHRSASNVHFSVGDAGIKLICIAIFLLGFASYVSYMIGMQQLAKSAGWYPTEGNIEEMGSNGLPMPLVGRFLPITCPYAKYSYVVDGKMYFGQQNCGPSIVWIRWVSWKRPELAQADPKETTRKLESDLRQAQIDVKTDPEAIKKVLSKHFEDALFKIHYKPVKVRYDKEHPEQSALDSDVMQGEKSQLNTSLILMALGGILFGLTYFHAYITAPVADDPTLSLDAALKHQRRGGRY